MIFIGTSGYFYKNWIGDFYPADLPKSKYFEYYVKFFNSLELNSTFYRFPKISTIKNWKYKIKNNFKLSIKANRIITHTKKLKYNENYLNEFIDTISILKEKLGVILFQLPPSLKYDIERLEDFILKLNKNLKYAIEFRNKSWYNINTYKILKKYNIALVWHDFNQEFNFTKTADFEYVRFHGYSGKYIGRYPDKILENIVKRISSNAFVYFNNTDDNSAFRDAIRFKKLIEEKK